MEASRQIGNLPNWTPTSLIWRNWGGAGARVSVGFHNFTKCTRHEDLEEDSSQTCSLGRFKSAAARVDCASKRPSLLSPGKFFRACKSSCSQFDLLSFSSRFPLNESERFSIEGKNTICRIIGKRTTRGHDKLVRFDDVYIIMTQYL